jgi:7-keto-8-aminopelargonate synthetase-like enzyme
MPGLPLNSQTKCYVRYIRIFEPIYLNVLSISLFLVEGIYVVGFSYPVVPQGKARIRVQISSAHSDEDIDRATDAFIRIGKELKVIP